MKPLSVTLISLSATVARVSDGDTIIIFCAKEVHASPALRYPDPVSDDLRFRPPPRKVPGSLAIANVFSGFSQIAWGVLGFGMIFFWGFAVNADVSFINFRGPLAETVGEMVRVEGTGASEGGRNISPKRIYANHYIYSIAGRQMIGISYSVGAHAEPGQRVTVEYAKADSARSRIAGMRRGQFGHWALVLAIFPLVGLVLVVLASARGWKRTRLLHTGHLVVGTLKNKRPTNTTVNRRVVYELTFEFTGRDGRRHEMKTRTSTPKRLEDDQHEPLLYDPATPARAYLLDEVPARPKFGMMGELLGSPRPALRLVLPAIILTINGWIMLLGLWK